ncbi:MAG: DNA repair protein RadC [Eubacteriales bacterium]|nr:DNA repair protein RadC [Eubacteriales bacterium]
MHEGHRQRLTKRFLNEGLEGFEDHEILEFILFYAIPRVDTNAIAHRLIDTFGSLSGVFEADAKDLEQVTGIGKNAAAYLSMFPDVFRAYQRSKLGPRPYVKSIKDACEFARSLLFGKAYEQFYVIWLDTQNRVIHHQRLSEGGISESPVYLNKVAAAALRHHAVKGLIAHNHPGGNVTPSKADIDTTHDILRALNMLGIELVDHIIISEDASFSFQADSLMGQRALKPKEAYAAEYTAVRQLVSVLAEKENTV